MKVKIISRNRFDQRVGQITLFQFLELLKNNQGKAINIKITVNCEIEISLQQKKSTKSSRLTQDVIWTSFEHYGRQMNVKTSCDYWTSRSSTANKTAS